MLSAHPTQQTWPVGEELRISCQCDYESSDIQSMRDLPDLSLVFEYLHISTGTTSRTEGKKKSNVFNAANDFVGCENA